MVDKTVYLGTDLTNCRCLLALLFILFKIYDLKGRLATLPWYKGQQKLMLIFDYWAIVNMCSSVLFLLTCHFIKT